MSLHRLPSLHLSYFLPQDSNGIIPAESIALLEFTLERSLELVSLVSNLVHVLQLEIILIILEKHPVSERSKFLRRLVFQMWLLICLEFKPFGGIVVRSARLRCRGRVIIEFRVVQFHVNPFSHTCLSHFLYSNIIDIDYLQCSIIHSYYLANSTH